MNKVNKKSVTAGAIIVFLIVVGLVLIFKKSQPQKLSMLARPTTYDTTDTSISPEEVGVSSTQISGYPGNQKIFLTITDPINNKIYTSPNIVIKAQTLPDAEVFVNDISLRADKSGNFNVPFTLEEGENEITIDVNDNEGNVVEKILTVTYQPS
jgi:hypothetical protein